MGWWCFPATMIALKSSWITMDLEGHRWAAALRNELVMLCAEEIPDTHRRPQWHTTVLYMLSALLGACKGASTFRTKCQAVPQIKMAKAKLLSLVTLFLCVAFGRALNEKVTTCTRGAMDLEASKKQNAVLCQEPFLTMCICFVLH
jgi:hypothetical protein